MGGGIGRDLGEGHLPGYLEAAGGCEGRQRLAGGGLRRPRLASGGRLVTPNSPL